MLSKYLWQALRQFSADIGDNWDMNQQTQSPHSVFFFCFFVISFHLYQKVRARTSVRVVPFFPPYSLILAALKAPFFIESGPVFTSVSSSIGFFTVLTH